MNLFDRLEKKQIKNNSSNLPLASRFLPRSLDNFVGQEHILSKGALFRTLIEQDKIFSVILFGPSGTGKSAIAKLIAQKTQSEVFETNATIVGINELKEIIKEVKHYRPEAKKRLLIILDEIHHFNRYQQDVLLPEVEHGNIILIGLTTENPYYYVNQALISRSLVVEFKKLTDENIKQIILNLLTDEEIGLGKYKLKINDDVVKYIAKYADGDARKAINVVDIVTTYLLANKKGSVLIDMSTVKQILPKISLKYDKSSDYHYDTISAFIKSVRGSDPDAALYWMMKMLDSGEDPRYIVRRLIILASEDIGNADPFALVLATSALQAVEFVGMPEAKIILSQIVTYFASTEKSNASYEALHKVEQELKNSPIQEVPNHLKDSSRDGKFLGHGKGYLYPHNYNDSFVVQDYMQKHKIFYSPKEIGKEKDFKQRLEKWREMMKRETSDDGRKMKNE